LTTIKHFSAKTEELKAVTVKMRNKHGVSGAAPVAGVQGGFDGRAPKATTIFTTFFQK